MEIVLNSNFSEISYNEMELIEGGGWREFGYAMGGTLLIEGGKNWWYIVGGSIMVVSGVAGVIVYPGLGGKLAGGGTAISGVATVVDGWNAK